MELSDAIEYIKLKHKNQKRKQGTPYYEHPIAVCNLLKEKNFSEEYQIVGLFHDLLEDTNTSYDEILSLTNKKIADAVMLLTKKSGYNMVEYIANIKQNEIARMVKLADRIHNLSETHLTSEEFKNRYIKETEEWFIELSKGTVFENDLKDVLLKLKTD